MKPLAAPLPAQLTGLFDSVNPLLAGLILIMSAFAGRGPAIFFAMFCAFVTVAGHKLAGTFGVDIPEVAGLTPQQLVLAAGGGLGLLTVILGRGR